MILVTYTSDPHPVRIEQAAIVVTVSYSCHDLALFVAGGASPELPR